VCLQSTFRRNTCMWAYSKTRRHIVLLQSHARVMSSVCHLTKARIACVMIQANWRGHRQRSEVDLLVCEQGASAVQIQAFYRGVSARGKYQRLRRATVCLQSTFRRYSCMRAYSKTRRHIVLLQTHHRGISSVSNSELTFDCMATAATVIQSFVRMLQTRRKFWSLREPYSCRLALHIAARKIQLMFLLWKMEGAVLEMESSTIILRRCIRGQLVRSASRFALSHMNTSIRGAPLSPITRVSSPTNHLTLATFRSWNRALGQARVAAAILIQTAFRRVRTRSPLRGKVSSLRDAREKENSSPFAVISESSVLQSELSLGDWNRKICPNGDDLLTGKEELQEQMNVAVVDIQRALRGWNVRKLYMDIELERYARKKLESTSAHKIQKWFCRWKDTINARKVSQQRTLLIHEDEIENKTQQSTLGVCRTGNADPARNVASTAHCEELILARQGAAALNLQKSWRRYVKVKEQRCRRTMCATTIQATVRRFLAAKIFGSLNQSCAKQKAAILVQSVVRSYLKRKRFVALLKASLGMQRLHREFVVQRDGEILKKHLAKLEAKSQLAVREFMLDHDLSTLIDQGTTCAPSYLEELQTWKLEYESTRYDAPTPMSRTMEQGISSLHHSTPVRSNKR